MNEPARFSPRARREVAAALRALEHDSARRTLRAEVETAARRLGQNPHLGSVRPYMPGPFRFWLFPRFGFVLVYDPHAEPVEILRFVHTRQDLPKVLAELSGRAAPEAPS